jgi:hypothetical protein
MSALQAFSSDPQNLCGRIDRCDFASLRAKVFVNFVLFVVLFFYHKGTKDNNREDFHFKIRCFPLRLRTFAGELIVATLRRGQKKSC